MDENLSDVIVRLLFAAVLLYHVFNVAESILEFVVITQKSVAFTVSGNHVLEFFCDHVMVLLWQQMWMQGIAQSIVGRQMNVI